MRTGCTRVVITLLDGSTLSPVPMKNRTTKEIAYRVSEGGKGGNKLSRTYEVAEPEMIACVRRGMAVRAATVDGARHGQYRNGGRSVAEVRIDGVPV